MAAPAEWIGDHDLYTILADVAARQRDQSALRRYAPQAEILARKYGHELYLGIALRAQGVAHHLSGELEPADRYLMQALALFQKLDTRWQIGRTFFDLGHLAASQANLNLADDFFARALEAYEQVGAKPDAASARSALANLVRRQKT